MDNLALYNAVRSVPAEAKKPFDNGSFKGTDINPMWRIKTLTEQFGPCGVGWYYEVLSERAETYGDTVMAIVDLNLYVKAGGEWSKPIFGTGGNTLVKATRNGQRPSDEGYKMALTDALSVACKALGIGADVYFERDATKYTAPREKENDPAPQPAQQPVQQAMPAPMPSVRQSLNAWEASHRDMNWNPIAEITRKAGELGITAERFNILRGSLIKARVLPYILDRDLQPVDLENIVKAIRLNFANEVRAA